MYTLQISQAMKVCQTQDAIIQRRCLQALYLRSSMNSFEFLSHLGKPTLSKFSHMIHKLCHSQFLLVFCHCREAKPVLCLVLVDQIITATVIVRVLEKMTYLSHISASYLTGNNSSLNAQTPKLQKETLELICSGKVCLPNIQEFICQ